jgi:hypothetical protein
MDRDRDSRRRPGRWAIAAAGTLAAAVVVLGVSAVGQARPTARATIPPPPPMPPPGEFVGKIDNPYFPLKPGTVYRYRGSEDQDHLRDRVFVTHETKTIAGVKATVVRDRVWVNGEPEEKTRDWYAQDNRGNVWYLGENSFDRVHGHWKRSDGSWKTGRDGAKAGILMQAHPKVGETYRQEFYKGHAEDVAKVLSKSKSRTVPYGSFRHVLMTKEWTPLEPDVVDHKFYARGVGDIAEATVKGGTEKLKLRSITHRAHD